MGVTIKSRANGSVERYKARPVAKGFTQTYGIDYQTTFTPIEKINSIRVLMSLVVNSIWPLHQLDVKKAQLNGDLVRPQIPGVHECSWRIRQSKGHHRKLKVPITRPKRCLRDVYLPNPQLMVTSAKVYL